MDELIKWLHDEKAFGHANKYHTHPNLLEDLYWSVNQIVLPDVKDHPVDSFYSVDPNYQTAQNASVLITKTQKPGAGTDHLQPKSKTTLNSAHVYNLHSHKSVINNK